jgi:plastocyanin domain-containing protein
MTLDRWLVLLGGIAAIGWVLWYFLLSSRSSGTASAGASGVQEAVITIRGGYDPAEIRVRAGQPVRLVFDRQEDNPCSEELVLADFRIRQFLPAHRKTVVQFTPQVPGTHEFTCGMGMLHGRVIAQ